MTTKSTSVLIFTDGACSGNPGPGGWGSIVAMPDGTVKEIGGGQKETTNNQMELTATIRALALLEATEPSTIVLYTDSTYVIKGITQWIFGWRSRGWKNAEGKDVANRHLWEELLKQVMRLKPSTIDWKYVRGHAGYPGNERCDEIAVSFAKGKSEPLYIGPLDGYFVDLTHLPAEEALPEMKSAASKSKTGSGTSKGTTAAGPAVYLSYHNGVLMRHKTWAECEKHVKGQSNAKFKKAKSAQEEREILAGWGLDPAGR
ncbi:MAG: ribonuclease HI [Candidatus Obscuribacter sp.]|nr:ribonuclease HI [Candidatus Obscuribacter sp.]MBP6593421.1 ribonuclease HI [Candidatus Obscuribacter sp.]MDQ5967429.1 Ribonuclease [Cyanobacteriota bacterium erpe_2018_sw_39hr_WHONDRS-SW48-000098_B_bin.30]